MSTQSQMMQWMSLTEEVIFLLDGSLHLSDLLRPPEHNPHSNYFDSQIQQLVSASDGLDAAALSAKIEEICRHGHDNLCQMQTDYQLQALTGLWAAREQCLRAQRERCAKERNRTATAAGRATDGDGAADADQVKSKLSMMLLFPLLQSQAKTDPALRSVTTRLLTEFLRERAASQPMSISDADGSLAGLEDMLIEWMRGEGTSASQLREAATALVCLACAKQSLLTVVKTIGALEEAKGRVEELEVGDVLGPFEELEGGKREPQVIMGTHHVRSWKCASEIRVGPDMDATVEAEMGKASLAACQGKYLYTTNEEGYGIAKVGTGYFLTIRY